MAMQLEGVRGALGWRTLSGVLAYLIVLLLAAAASFNGYYDKWGFRDGEVRFSAELMLDGQAERPFVFRRLNPWITNAIAEATPDSLKSTVQVYAQSPEPGKSDLGPPYYLNAEHDAFWRYNVLYYLTFAEWFAALVVLAQLCARYAGLAAGAAASILFALMFPLFLSQGGYFYDFPEILFFSMAVYTAARGWVIPLAAIVAVGTLNKETMLFFAPTLLPFLAANMGAVRGVAATAGLSVLAGGIYLLIRNYYAGNAGASAEFHLLNNIEYYLNPLHLFEMEKTYGLLLFRAYSVVGVAFVILLAAAGWRIAPKTVRGHVVLTLMVNLPLFAVLAYRAEMRNLSLTFVGWTLLVACALGAWIFDPSNARPRILSERR